MPADVLRFFLVSFGILLASGPGQGQNEKPAPLDMPSAQAVDEWRRIAAASLEAVRRDEFGQHLHRSCRSLRVGELPCFKIETPPRNLAGLPEPTTPFAVALNHVYDPKLAELAHYKNLHTLFLKESLVTPKNLKAFAELKNLRHLILIKYVGNATLQALTELPNLESLEVHDFRVGDAGIDAICKLPKLHTLILYEVPLDDAGFKKVAGIKTLKTFHLQPSFAKRLTNVQLRTLADAPQLESLTFVNSVDANIDWKLLTAFKNLRALDLRSVPLTDAQMKDLTALQNLETFRHMLFSDGALTAAGLKELSAFPKLKSLKLVGPHINDESFKEIGKLRQLTHLSTYSSNVSDAGLRALEDLRNLEHLDLSTAQISDLGLKSLHGMRKLKYLNLSSTTVTNAGLRELLGLKQLHTLHYHGTKITPQAILALKRVLTGLEIDF